MRMNKKQFHEVSIRAAAQKLLGFESLRPGQEEAIQALLDGQDVVFVAPTGSGKSAVYQIAGSLMEGATVIVSPLIALQKDQADSIGASKLAGPAVVNSMLTSAEQRIENQRIEDGDAEFIFLAPEQLRKAETIARLKSAGVALFTVDEAHCISQWGHDFRPDYLELARVIQALGHPPTLALTATASNEVRGEIVERLGLREPVVVVRGFDRPNISLRVDAFETEDQKLEALAHRVRWSDKPGIIYTATRKNAENIMAVLSAEDVNSTFYHGGLKPAERDEIHESFMQGGVEVMVATNAFGMGVDKPDVRFVFHFDIPDSLDAYYQEIGRAGRDGENASAVLFYRKENLGAMKFHTGGAEAEIAERRKERLERMRDYAETTYCRREMLLRYFGEDPGGRCNNCDNCEVASVGAALDPSVGTRREVV